MRVRPQRQSEIRRNGSSRRPHLPLRPAAPVEDQQDEGHRHLRHETRLRASGGPEDVAHYHCACGFTFEASVSTSVSCPHCGAGQAW